MENYRVTKLVSYEPLVLPERQPVRPTMLARSRPTIPSRPPVESTVPKESEATVAALVVTPQVKAIAEPRAPEPEPGAPALKLGSKMPVIPITPTTQIVAIGTFAHESPVTLPAARPAARPAVEAGVFGDPDGKGSGHGKGLGGTNPNMVVSSAFGNGAISALNSGGLHAKAGSHQASTGSDTPVEITFKPKADYTEEGRKQKINGEVRLEVVFKSDGRIHVIRVLQGLGYGLDEQAVKAAEQIKFKPALHEGQPVDATAMVHIIFELIS